MCALGSAPEKNGLRLYKEYVIKHMGKRSICSVNE